MAKQGKKSKKEYGGPREWQFFNVRPMPRKKNLMERMIVSGEKVLKKAKAEGYVRWVTFDQFQEKFEGTWNEGTDFKRWWLDQALREIEVWVYNGVMFAHGRNDRKSEKKAEEACARFRKLWV